MNYVDVRGKVRQPPKRLNFDRDIEVTFGYLKEIRENFARGKLGKKAWIHTSKNSQRKYINGYTDYSKLEKVSTSAALVLTAEYDRARELSGSTPPAIDLPNWNGAVFTALLDLGFFEIIGVANESGERFRTNGNIRTMSIVTGTTAEELAVASKRVMELSKFVCGPEGLPSRYLKEVTTAISEGLTNVTGWAYPKEHDFRYRHIGKWWITAAADKQARTLTISLFDQGATIPATYASKLYPSERLKLHEKIVQFFKKALHSDSAEPYVNDGVYIEGAMRYGASSTGLDNRGKGLPQMKALIDFVGGGALTVLSRGGICAYSHGEEIRHDSSSMSIGGTLIEWRLALPVDSKDD